MNVNITLKNCQHESVKLHFKTEFEGSFSTVICEFFNMKERVENFLNASALLIAGMILLVILLVLGTARRREHERSNSPRRPHKCLKSCRVFYLVTYFLNIKAVK